MTDTTTPGSTLADADRARYAVMQLRGNTWRSSDDTLAVEEPLEIRLG
ncbi:MAG: hypothetical protein LBF16_11985 [Pseudomonadales bacterium]|jgi:hypothetical protein|nr:hypothetical protein [Pseudomonadales bacterium]